MKLSALSIAAASLLLAACGTDTGDRTASGAGIGAAAGIPFGPAGVIAGGAIGAGTGATTSPDAVNLGTPLWEQENQAAQTPEE